MIQYIKLVRPLNLVFILVFYTMVRYGFLLPQNITLALSPFDYILFILSMLCIAAAGYVINDIMDYEADLINKPKKVIIRKFISEKSAYNYYVSLNIIGVALGFYLSHVIEKSNVFILFILIASLLYFYSAQLKKVLVINNLAISFIIFLSVMMVVVMDLFPLIDSHSHESFKVFFDIILDYAWFAFFITLIREIVKDSEDELGDRELNYSTIPINFGKKATNVIVAVFIIFLVAYLLYYINSYLVSNDLYWSAAYLLLSVCGSLLWCFFKIVSAKEKSTYSKISFVLKMVMFLGMLSLIVTYQNILHK